MGFLANLLKKLCGREEPKVVAKETPKKEKAPITPITRKKNFVGANSLEHSLGGFTPLPLLARQVIAKTIDTLSSDPETLCNVCSLNPNQAKYVARAYATDKKWAETAELSYFVDKEDVRMLYFIFKQCGNYALTAKIFGVNTGAMMDYFNKMSPLERREAFKFTIFPDNSRATRLNKFVRQLSDAQLANLLCIFRKVRRVNALRYVIPMYRDVQQVTMSKKLFALWEYAVKEEARRETVK